MIPGGGERNMNFKARLAKKVGKRHSEAHVEVFELGHWEQMQLALALQKTSDVAHDDRAIMSDVEFEAMWGELDPEWLASALHIFGAHGTITIIRHNEQE